MQPQRRNRQLALLGASHSINHSLVLIAPPLLTLIMTDLGVDILTIGTVATMASFLYGLGSLAGGPLGDKIGETKTITLFLTLSGLSALIMLAAATMRSIYVYALALMLIALWASLYHPTANSLISKTFKGKVAESMGLHGTGGTVGTVLTPVVSVLIGATFGWQWAFVTFGLLSIFLALTFTKGFGKTQERNSQKGSILAAFKIRQLWTLLVFNVMIGFFMKGIELYFPTFLKQNRGMDPFWASVAYTLLLTAGVPGQWLGGKASDKIGSKKVLIATMATICLALLSLLFLPVHMIGIAVFVILYGFAFYAHQPALNSLTGFLSSESQRGAVFGIFFFTSFGIGSLCQLLAGYLAQTYSFDAAFYLIAAFALIALLLSLRIPDKREHDALA